LLVIWEEALGPNVSVSNIHDPYFMKYHLQSMNEMISASINHPCIFFHAFFNEGIARTGNYC
jgi:beta-glucuronidase